MLCLVDRPVKHRLRRDFFRIEVPIRSVICGTTIMKGQYTIPFSFCLPERLTGTCRLGNPPADLLEVAGANRDSRGDHAGLTGRGRSSGGSRRISRMMDQL